MKCSTSILVYLTAVITLSFASGKDEWWQVDIAQGPVRGQRLADKDLYVFYNIPYATAPTGEHKFKAPLPPPIWTEPYNAVDEKIICPQTNLPLFPGNLTMQENCLIANVYVPDTEEKNLSVLVYVHGGAYQIGHGELVKLTNLMKPKDFITVTFNYRLGIHGFLCLGTEDVPGNGGMKDQIALLRWVQHNIGAFGGNPDDVTLLGYSAGSAAVDLLMISESAKGLFHRVIEESGASLMAFAVQIDPLQNAKDHAITLNFTNTDDIYALEKFYKNLSYDILTADAFMSRTDSTFLFAPCVERDLENEPFLTKSPLSIIKNGDYKKVPLLCGFANMEGLLRIDFFDLMWKDMMNAKFADFLPADLKFETEDEREEVAKKIKSFYFGEEPISNNNILRYVDYFSDVIFVYSALRAVRLHVEAGHNQVYLYEYSFVDDDTPVVPHTNIRGANHCAETVAVGDGATWSKFDEDMLSEEYKAMKKIIREMWHNFIKTGKPVPTGSSLPEWPAVARDTSPHMSLGQTVELRDTLVEERFHFWDDIYEKHYREPIPPPNPPEPRLEL